MKYLFIHLILIFTAFDVNAQNIYESSKPVSLTITAPFKSLFDKRINSTSVILLALKESIPGVLQLVNPSTMIPETYDIEILMRGNFTLSDCQFPKLKINFKKNQTKKYRYFNKKKYDLTTHCMNSVEGVTYYAQAHQFLTSSPYREKFLFDIQEELGIAVPKTQNAFIHYIDNTDSTLVTYSQKPAFFTESQSNMIERLNGLYQIIGENDFSKKIIQGQIIGKVDENLPKNIFKNIQENVQINKNDAIVLHFFNALIMNYDFYIKIDPSDSRHGDHTTGFHNVKCIAINENDWRLFANDLNLSNILSNTAQTEGHGHPLLGHIQDVDFEKMMTRLQKIGTPEDFKSVINFYLSKKSDLYKMADSISHDQMFMKNYLLYLDVFYKRLDSINK